MAQLVYVSSDEADPWPVNCPTTLEDICVTYFVKNIFIFLERTDDSYRLKPGISFPQGLSDKIMYKLVETSNWLNTSSNNVFGIFNNRATTSLTELSLRYTAVKTEHLEFLCLHPIRKLDISYCPQIKSKFIDAINQAGRTLQCLNMGGSDEIERLDYLLHEDEHEDFPGDRGDGRRDLTRHSLNLPHLRSLSLREFQGFKNMDGEPTSGHKVIEHVIAPLRNLTHLDLYKCGLRLGASFVIEVGNLDLPHLVSLSLCDCLNGSEHALENLMKLKNLR